MKQGTLKLQTQEVLHGRSQVFARVELDEVSQVISFKVFDTYSPASCIPLTVKQMVWKSRHHFVVRIVKISAEFTLLSPTENNLFSIENNFSVENKFYLELTCYGYGK